MPVFDTTAGQRWLVINADDFGLHPALNQAIAQAHRRGILTSTSLVACGAAFDEAVELARAAPELDVGVHLTLVEEIPLTPLDQVASLVGPNGAFWPNYRRLSRRLLSGQIRLAEVRRELTAQVERLLAAGLQPSHLDSHQHVHLLPGLWPIAVELARRYNIAWIRVPAFDSLTRHTVARTDSLFRLGLNLLSGLRRRQLPGLSCVRASPGLYLSGRLTTADLAGLLPGLPPGLSELVTHPGFSGPALQQRYRWNFHWQEEYEALVAPQSRQALAAHNIRLTRFSELTVSPPAPAQATSPPPG
jgi:hopanoid biosynthesis associated protein HpnK